MSQDLGLDRSGNGNNWTLNNLTIADQMIDRPTNNFATQNPLCNAISNAPDSGDASPTFSKGNLRIVTALTPAGRNASTIGVLSGKYYAEMYHEAGVSGEWVSPRNIIGITTNLVDSIQSKNGGNIGNLTTSEDVGYSGQSGNKNVGNSWTSYGATWAIGDIIGVALNMDDEEVTFYKNNASQGTISFTAGGEGHFMSGDTSAGGGLTAVWNYGQDSSFAGNKTAQGNRDGNGIGDFYYEPPTDFLALCTQNLPEPAVTPGEHFNTVTYSGNGATRSITGVGFQPDWVWFKEKNNLVSHRVFDSVRGATKRMFPDHNGVESTQSNALTSFDSDGFSLGDGGAVNGGSDTYVAWNWKAGGTGVANTDGDINSTVSANVDAGFSIVSYTGNETASQTVGHGLSKAPQLVITKQRVNTGSWQVLINTPHDYAEGDYFYVDSTSAVASSANVSFLPTATTWEMKAGQQGNVAAAQIAYCFHSVDGYSKVGSYIGNGLVDGTFAYTGFRPAYLLIKRIDAIENWWAIDVERDPFNPAYHLLYPDGNNAEYSGGGPGDSNDSPYDITSNGFKNRTSNGNWNAKSGVYIYLAIAETPFKYTNAR